MQRCGWVNLKNPAYIAYHDSEWGVPCHDDRALFELLILECFQAGLSWECVLNKRENFRRAYDSFDVSRVAEYDSQKVNELLANPEIIRNRLKITASINNSQVFREIQKEFGSFDHYIWSFTDGVSVVESYLVRTTSDTPILLSTQQYTNPFNTYAVIATFIGILCAAPCVI